MIILNLRYYLFVSNYVKELEILKLMVSSKFS